MKISKGIIKLISMPFFNIEKFLFKMAMYAIEFERGNFGRTNITLVEKLESGDLVTRVIKDKEEFLEIMFLPLQEFEERFKNLIDENGVMYSDNKELLEYRDKIHKRYEKYATRVIVLFIITYCVGLSSNVIANLIPVTPL